MTTVVAYDVMAINGELGDSHFATAQGPETFSQRLPAKLKSVDALPQTVRQPLETDGEVTTLIDALSKAGAPAQDLGEPSWGVLAQIRAEVQFMQVLRRLTFMRDGWAVPVDDYWASVDRTVSRHRFFLYLQSIALPPQEAHIALVRLGEMLDPDDLEVKENDLCYRLRQEGTPIGKIAWGFCYAHCQSGASDAAIMIAGAPAQARANEARVLLEMSPYSAFAMANLIEQDWDKVKGDVASWREKVKDNPAVLGAWARSTPS